MGPMGSSYIYKVSSQPCPLLSPKKTKAISSSVGAASASEVVPIHQNTPLSKAAEPQPRLPGMAPLSIPPGMPRFDRLPENERKAFLRNFGEPPAGALNAIPKWGPTHSDGSASSSEVVPTPQKPQAKARPTAPPTRKRKFPETLTPAPLDRKFYDGGTLGRDAVSADAVPVSTGSIRLDPNDMAPPNQRIIRESPGEPVAGEPVAGCRRQARNSSRAPSTFFGRWTSASQMRKMLSGARYDQLRKLSRAQLFDEAAKLGHYWVDTNGLASRDLVDGNVTGNMTCGNETLMLLILEGDWEKPGSQLEDAPPKMQVPPVSANISVPSLEVKQELEEANVALATEPPVSGKRKANVALATEPPVSGKRFYWQQTQSSHSWQEELEEADAALAAKEKEKEKKAKEMSQQQKEKEEAKEKPLVVQLVTAGWKNLHKLRDLPRGTEPAPVWDSCPPKAEMDAQLKRLVCQEALQACQLMCCVIVYIYIYICISGVFHMG